MRNKLAAGRARLSNPRIQIRKIKKLTTEDVSALILNTSPWSNLGFTKKDAKQMAKTSQDRELLGAYVGRELVGFALYKFGFLGGAYLGNLVVKGSYRGHKIGEKLMRAMETQVFQKSKNLYLCVSSFNKGAQKFYRRLNYKKVGVLKALLVKKHDEYLFRKSRGPIRG